MNALAVAQGYFDAWTHRDADGIIAAFTEGGTYSDPSVGQGISREATANYARGLWDAFPDLTFEIISNAETGPGTVVAQWLMLWYEYRVATRPSAYRPRGRGSRS